MVLFEFGNSYNKQGYWSYDQLVLQIEDRLKLLKVLYPSFDLVFLFDHLCGYDWAHEGRLKEIIIRKYFGGKQPNMRDTVILGKDEFLGPSDHMLKNRIHSTCRGTQTFQIFK